MEIHSCIQLPSNLTHFSMKFKGVWENITFIRDLDIVEEDRLPTWNGAQ